MEKEKTLHVVPSWVVTIIMMIVCLVLFGLAFFEDFYWCLDSPYKAEMAAEACGGSYMSFWNMVIATSASFAFIGVVNIFAVKEVWRRFLNSSLGIIHMLLLLCLARLAYLNLYGEYISLFGATPRRIQGVMVIYLVSACCIGTIIILIKNRIAYRLDHKS